MTMTISPKVRVATTASIAPSIRITATEIPNETKIDQAATRAAENPIPKYTYNSPCHRRRFEPSALAAGLGGIAPPDTIDAAQPNAPTLNGFSRFVDTETRRHSACGK